MTNLDERHKRAIARAVGEWLAQMDAIAKGLQDFMASINRARDVLFEFNNDLRRRIEAYDARLFKRYKVGPGNWKSLVLATRAASYAHKTGPAPSPFGRALRLPPLLELSLTEEGWKELARFIDPWYQRQVATGWEQAFSVGRPKVRLTPDQEKQMRDRTVSLSRKSNLLAGGDKLEAQRIYYRARKSRPRKKFDS